MRPLCRTRSAGASARSRARNMRGNYHRCVRLRVEASMTRLSIALALCSACAVAQSDVGLARNRDPSHPLYVGRTADGEIVMAATHADSMRGLAVAATDRGAPKDTNGDDLLICRKELITGTHFPNWICRYPTEVERRHLATQDFYDHPRNCTNCIR